MHKLNHNGNRNNFGLWICFGFITLTQLGFWRRPSPSPLYYILDFIIKTTLKWIFVLGLSKIPKIFKFGIPQLCGLIISSYKLQLKGFQ
jgi:hypothetical protein